jgi:hypothetical protein
VEKAKLDSAVRGLRATWMKWGEQLDALEAMLSEEATPGQQAKHLLDYFATAWHGKYRQRYVVTNGAAAIAALKKLLKDLTIVEVEKAMTAFLASNDPFYVKARHPLSMFVPAVNKFTVAAPAADRDMFEMAPPDCRHAPKCKTDLECSRRAS